MLKKAAGRLDDHDLTLEGAALPVTESETAALSESKTAALPVIEAEAEVEAQVETKEETATEV